jgi:signal recognition particle receptor subunit beta
MRFEWSFLLDALQTERDQGITIDTSQIRLRTAARDIVLIDAPGHAEFLRNMITGAAQADAAVLIIDATEGVRDQTRRHGYLLHLLGVRQVAVVINKMDRVGFDADRFAEIESEIAAHLAGLGLTVSAVIPISARHGDGVTRHVLDRMVPGSDRSRDARRLLAGDASARSGAAHAGASDLQVRRSPHHRRTRGERAHPRGRRRADHAGRQASPHRLDRDMAGSGGLAGATRRDRRAICRRHVRPRDFP